MNAKNTIVHSMETSLEIPLGNLDSTKYEEHKNEQSEPSISTSKTVSITALILNAIEKSKGIASDIELLEAKESIRKLVEWYFCEQHKTISSLKDSKVVRENFLNEIYSLSLSDKEQITTLQSQFLQYRKFCITENKSQKQLFETWDKILKLLCELSSGNKCIADEIEIIIQCTEMFSAIKHELITLSDEREALLDNISSQMSHIEELSMKS